MFNYVQSSAYANPSSSVALLRRVEASAVIDGFRLRQGYDRIKWRDKLRQTQLLFLSLALINTNRYAYYICCCLVDIEGI